MPAVAIGWRKKTKYAIRNAAAVQYCSLFGVDFAFAEGHERSGI
jgi:hypothetical protein